MYTRAPLLMSGYVAVCGAIESRTVPGFYVMQQEALAS